MTGNGDWVLGRTIRHPIMTLDTFDAPAGVRTVTFESQELNAMCPVTGQPDGYAVTITYTVNRVCIESKSLKLYLWSFRDRGVFAEGIAGEVAQKIADTTDSHAEVILEQAIRGGIIMTVTATAGAFP